ncbi:nucleoid-associated protein [Pseudomonas petrae]|uniref:Nucleoid-associated protein n=1 Tax=Pseudomonas petrae TaxID=2912190 RepID=A0ABS9I8R8_9PSED|nr:nucleoid-associated protein [Pseudomonas petrae]MCF7534033.1 nucleoid-associated protein [Pseudomonas petrae]MCF7539386.1 nucleoid-associated protein [Pseudomonas petrae]MCF7543616.1 nucleoid-associated protein [Pseudomonas petrae]MCF7557271.1 nucleoid-associated protein [Pseudomonas petrae]
MVSAKGIKKQGGTMSFFTEDEEKSLTIKKMILHVVGSKSFEAMPERDLEEQSFFTGKILETAASPVFMFKDFSSSRRELEAIARGDNLFEAGAQGLARSFNAAHVSGSADGVLCMFELEVDDPAIVIFSLIKYDYKFALEQDDENPQKSLRRILTALVDDKKAIQKTALVRVINGVACQTVSATDRTKQGPDIADYFADFLSVTRAISNRELSEVSRKLLRSILQACKKELPDEDVPKAIKRAQGVLGRRLKIDENAIVEAVLVAAGAPDDVKAATRLERETRKRVKSSKLHELTFKPDRNILRQPYMRKISTVEGVTITFPDKADSPNVRVVDLEAERKQIIVETNRVTEDSVVTPKPGVTS